MYIEDIVWMCVGIGVVYWWAIRSLFKNRIHFISTDLTPVTQRTPLMNRVPILYPKNAIIDVYWEDVTEEFSRGVKTHHFMKKTHHLVNLTILILIVLYFISNCIVRFIVWLFL